MKVENYTEIFLKCLSILFKLKQKNSFSLEGLEKTVEGNMGLSIQKLVIRHI
jgi:hypothetical protein